jgi:hypothetical protein
MLHPRPFYYLENFATALAWLQQRYDDLLDESERAFMVSFGELPRASAALLVRMIGRKGEDFRTAKLRYPEIGCPVAAAAVLIEQGWLDSEPAPQLDWCPEVPDVLFHLRIRSLCERLRLLYFGDFEQDWSAFVLADLGIFRYEKVALDCATRAFQKREHLDAFCALFCCRQLLEERADIECVLEALPPQVTDNDWLEARRSRLQFRIAQRCEQQSDFERALRIYRECRHPGARLRMIRVLERLEQTIDALQLAALVREAPADEIEVQQVTRMWPRLQRKAGLAAQRANLSREWTTFQLVLPVSERPAHLERATGAALSEPENPVHYVENGLINSLFGLLCWEAIFAPVTGAFFHEFQAAPADLHTPGFHGRRAQMFARCFEQLDSEAYRDTIYRNFHCKSGIQSPFVFWALLSESLLALALECVPREHLRLCFERILANIRVNTAGLPDLIQFWPGQRRYRLIEVKGPGDRLQDNQTRWLTFCASRGIPVSVCHVSWTTSQ